MANKRMIHWNGSRVCAIDTETTGLDPDYHEITQLAVVPLMADFTPDPDIIPFNCFIIPDHPERMSKAALRTHGVHMEKLREIGIASFEAVVMFEDWVEKLGLGFTAAGRKKIIPLGQNYDGFDKQFLCKLLGREQYEEMFDYHSKDSGHVTNYLNDRIVMKGGKAPYPHISLSRVAHRMGIDNTKAHDALEDAYMCAEVYRRHLAADLGLFT